MKNLWSKKELILATNGLDPSLNFLKKTDGVYGISIDDRTLKKGDLFIALKGNKFDGHEFIKSAMSKGAAGLIVSDTKLAKEYGALLVKNTSDALIRIGKFARDRFEGITIALTGSSGKTSTNHILSSSLKKYGPTHNTQGNNNNIIGVSLTLSRLPSNFKYCVLELGMNNPGEIKRLTKIVKPDIALITNVSNSHFQNFKNEEEIAHAKSEIFLGLKKNGVAILNSDNAWCDFLLNKAKKVGVNTHLFGYSKKSDTKIIKITDDKKGTKVYFDNKIKLHLNYLNTTQAINAIATISIVKQLKLNLEKTFKAITNIEPLPGRGQIIKINFNQDHKTFVIDDSYNANPDSMRAALSNFYSLKTKFKNYQTILIIGDMLELGRISKKSHKELIPIIKKINPHILITLGHYTNYLCKELSPYVNCNPYYSIETLLEDIKKILKPRQLILIKGSNGTGLWKLVPFFKNHLEEHNAA